MELAQLRSFLRVAEEGSISRAAEGLFLTQPAVTKQMRLLELELGALLLERTGRGVRLTPAGEGFREHVRRALAMIDEAQQVVRDVSIGTAGRLVVGAGVTTSILHLPQWLQPFQESFPGVDVVVRTGRSHEITRLTLDRQVDMGLVTSPVQHPDLRVCPVLEEEIALVGPTRYPYDACAAGELARLPLILFPRGAGFREYMDGVFARAGVQALVKMESDSVEATKRFVSVGLGFSFLPHTAVGEEIAAGDLKKIELSDLPRLSRRTSVIHRSDRYLTTPARAFLERVCAGAGD